MTFQLQPGDYVTKEQMDANAEHWAKVGPELLEMLCVVEVAYGDILAAPHYNQITTLIAKSKGKS